VHRKGQIPSLTLRAFMGQGHHAPIKAPGGSRGIAHRKGQIPSLTLRAFMGQGHHAPIKAPGVSRGIVNRQKTGRTATLKTCRRVLYGFVQCMQPGSGA